MGTALLHEMAEATRAVSVAMGEQFITPPTTTVARRMRATIVAKNRHSAWPSSSSVENRSNRPSRRRCPSPNCSAMFISATPSGGGVQKFSGIAIE